MLPVFSQKKINAKKEFYTENTLLWKWYLK